jgi:hypothetical protein
MKRKSRVTPCGFKHELEPISVGMATAEFLPADPAVWLKAAAQAGLQVGLTNGRLLMTWEGVAAEERNFLLGWLHGTPGGDHAVAALLAVQT